MANIAVFVPRNNMYEQTKEVLKEDQIEVLELKTVETEDVVKEAENAVHMGAEIIVARGMQSLLIRSYTNIPVVDISLTGQELGLLVQAAKKKTAKEVPVIGFIGYKNIFSSMSHFEELYEIKLKVYHVSSKEEIPAKIKQAFLEKVDVIIGGDAAIGEAEKLGIKTLFLHSTKDSVREALRVAMQVGYALDLEKHSNAQLETILDTSFCGIIKVDKTGKIIVVNRMVEELLGKSEFMLEGRLIEEELEELDRERIEELLNGKRDIYSAVLKQNGYSFMVVAAPIQYDKQIGGAILTCYKVKKSSAQSSKYPGRGLYGNSLGYEFQSYLKNSTEMKLAVEQAKFYALSSSPVCIYGEESFDKEVMAALIHNYSSRKKEAFFVLHSAGMNKERQEAILFGEWKDIGKLKWEDGLLKSANGGTVFIGEVDKLSLSCQYRLLEYLNTKRIVNYEKRSADTTDVRIIAASEKDLYCSVLEGNFLKELYYKLHNLSLMMPARSFRKKEKKNLLAACIKKYEEIYSSVSIVTQEAYRILEEYNWDGGLIQMEGFCERLILTASKKEIDGIFVRDLLNQLYPVYKRSETGEQVVLVKSPAALELEEALKNCHGNRKETAKQLGISTATLWRRMKKYNMI